MLDVLSVHPFRVFTRIVAGAFPSEMKVSQSGNTLFLTNSSSNSLEIIDLKRAIPPTTK
jgi:hypothetical protein